LGECSDKIFGSICALKYIYLCGFVMQVATIV